MKKFNYLAKFLITLFVVSFICCSEAVFPNYSVNNCSCGLNHLMRMGVEGRIIGGVKTKIAEFPWQVAFFDVDEFFCGGSLINDRYVLTAAHCFKAYDTETDEIETFQETNRVRIVLGMTLAKEWEELIKNKNLQFYQIDFLIYHPFYDPSTLEYDVSLVKINGIIKEYSRNMLPICFPPQKSDFSNSDAIISGWGEVYNHSGPVVHLRKTYVKILDDRTCRRRIQESFFSDIMLCASFPGHDSCNGDSGGPLITPANIYQFMQIGIISFGVSFCGNDEKPGVYTRLSRFLPWIRKRTMDAIYCKNM